MSRADVKYPLSDALRIAHAEMLGLSLRELAKAEAQEAAEHDREREEGDHDFDPWCHLCC